MQLIVLYGPPGVGKLTVGQELATQTGYKLFHNHLTVDLVCSLFPFGSEPAERLSREFRLTMLREAALADLPGVIFTYVHANDSPGDLLFVQQLLDNVEQAGGQVQFVQLLCSDEARYERVQAESRARYGKLRDPAAVAALSQRYDLVSPIPYHASMQLDTTTLSPADAATQIRTNCKLPTSAT